MNLAPILHILVCSINLELQRNLSQALHAEDDGWTIEDACDVDIGDSRSLSEFDLQINSGTRISRVPILTMSTSKSVGWSNREKKKKRFHPISKLQGFIQFEEGNLHAIIINLDLLDGGHGRRTHIGKSEAVAYMQEEAVVAIEQDQSLVVELGIGSKSHDQVWGLAVRINARSEDIVADLWRESTEGRHGDCCWVGL